jgi:hypothetical protein
VTDDLLLRASISSVYWGGLYLVSSHEEQSREVCLLGPLWMTPPISPSMSPQVLSKGPPVQPQPGRLRPSEELPPPPEEPVSLPEREASTGTDPWDPRGASMGFWQEQEEQGPTSVLAPVHRTGCRHSLLR